MNLLSIGDSLTDFCGNADMQSLISLIGTVITIVKVAIPVLIIALGIFDFGKAVVAEKEDEIKKQTKRLIYRVVAGIVIFFIPAIVLFIFGSLKEYETQEEESNFQQCQECFLHPSKCK